MNDQAYLSSFILLSTFYFHKNSHWFDFDADQFDYCCTYEMALGHPYPE